MITITWLHFKKPTHGKRDWFFTSVTAIAQEFTAEEIGASIDKLLHSHITEGNAYSNDICTISRHMARKSKSKHAKD